ncbi:hypothetical protein BT96DRAFT_685149 [Gymnopus androsaceus JB14]|uniref:Uncharacterized protein n=1 Tax=Gymnopus androsaceus JB14 TaxID=1447944 RepID=A0A6A4HRN1_9AGAR|nr:hypothetical protein BT96DRAFT_685149 [Gymnopus androsaceus JB14]
MEGLNNGFGYGTARTGATPGPIASAPAAPAARVRFTAAAQSISPPASAAPATSHQSRPQALRRSTTTATQNVAPADGLADRLRNLMEDPNRPPVDRASVVPSEAPSWGTVTSNSSRRQSGASDVLATLRSFPAHASRSSISSTEIPVGDPSAFLPAVPANRAPTQTQNTNPDRDGAPLSSAPSIPEASSRSAHRSNDHQVNQSTGPVTSRPVNHRLTSLPVNSSNTTNGNGSTRPRPSHMASMPFPGATTANNSYTPAYTNGSAYPNHNPLPTLPNFGGYTNSSSLGSAPPRALIHEYNSSPAVPNVNTVQSRASNANSATPVGNSLGLELGNDGEDRRNGYSPIPAFAAPTPRASHGLFLRAFSFDGYETEGTLYR